MLLLKAVEQIQDLGLNGDIQGGNRLIQEFYAALNDAAAPIFSLYSLMLTTLPPESCGRLNRDKTAAFICVPPTIDDERSRAAARALNEAVAQVFCQDRAEDTGLSVLFPYHTADCCGKHGTLRCDAV